ncbi:MAG: hypothetical protein LKF74_01590 [Megasphaera sp.]|jgi:diaminopimelate epimerase|nr:hypothetical protein [Megasphaera sp.]MCH4187270.1 hypothetical protein [Megasphaera sp.]MCH4217236.1 hypothetical protein [Megasphaera sp.]
MTIHYILANPSGNTTAFVFDAVAPLDRSAIAARLLQQTGAEQVGYLKLCPGKPIEVAMMGGEFCGNASRSAAAYALMQDGASEGEYHISCSGCDTLLPAHAQKRADGGYDAFIEMPRPTAIDAVIVDAGGQPARFYRVTLPGIVHFIHFVDTISAVRKDVFWQAVYDYAKDESYEAFGLVLFDPKHLAMLPAVYVTATDTLYWEQSCGSGSAAVAAVLGILGKRNVSCTVSQPGGTITIAATYADSTVQSICIGGPVSFNEKAAIDL